MKILVATDFSQPARRAADVGLALARRLGDELVLVYVCEPILITTPDFAVDVDTVQKAITERAMLNLEREAARLRPSGIEVSVRLGFGPVAETVVKVAAEVSARLVVVGTHGRGVVPRFFLGSAAERIVLGAECPVLVVRGGEAPEPALMKTSVQEPLRVLVGVDRTWAARQAVDWVGRLRTVLPMDVTFVHFYWPPEQFSRLGIVGAREMLEPDPVTISVLKRELASFIGELPGQGKVEIDILPGWGEIGSHLSAIAEERSADMLVLGTHQRRGLKRLWLGATLQPALHAARVPVLCIPAAMEDEVRPARIPRIKSVLVATDLSPLGNQAIAHAYALVDPGGTVHLAHVHERHLPSPLYAYEDRRGAISGTPVQTEYEQKLLALVPAEARERGITTQTHVIDGGYPPTALVQAANRLGVDAICLGSHGRTGLGRALMGSVAITIVENADRPVYIVRGYRP